MQPIGGKTQFGLASGGADHSGEQRRAVATAVGEGVRAGGCTVVFAKPEAGEVDLREVGQGDKEAGFERLEVGIHLLESERTSHFCPERGPLEAEQGVDAGSVGVAEETVTAAAAL